MAPPATDEPEGTVHDPLVVEKSSLPLKLVGGAGILETKIIETNSASVVRNFMMRAVCSFSETLAAHPLSLPQVVEPVMRIIQLCHSSEAVD